MNLITPPFSGLSSRFPRSEGRGYPRVPANIQAADVFQLKSGQLKFGTLPLDHLKALERDVTESAQSSSLEELMRKMNRIDKITYQNTVNGYTALLALLNREDIDRIPEGTLSPLVQALIDKKVDVNAVSKEGTTALMHAAYLGLPDIVTRLLEAGADPNIRTDGEESPLFIAAQEGHWEVVRQLLAWDADVTKAELADSIEGKSLQAHLEEHGIPLHQPTHLQVRH